MYSKNSELTTREREVLKQVMMGLTNRQIAENLTVTHHTVKAHVASILRKLDSKNRLEASLIAQRNNIINPLQD